MHKVLRNATGGRVGKEIVGVAKGEPGRDFCNPRCNLSFWSIAFVIYGGGLVSVKKTHGGVIIGIKEFSIKLVETGNMYSLIKWVGL